MAIIYESDFIKVEAACGIRCVSVCTLAGWQLVIGKPAELIIAYVDEELAKGNR